MLQLPPRPAIIDPENARAGDLTGIVDSELLREVMFGTSQSVHRIDVRGKNISDLPWHPTDHRLLTTARLPHTDWVEGTRMWTGAHLMGWTVENSLRRSAFMPLEVAIRGYLSIQDELLELTGSKREAAAQLKGSFRLFQQHLDRDLNFKDLELAHALHKEWKIFLNQVRHLFSASTNRDPLVAKIKQFLLAHPDLQIFSANPDHMVLSSPRTAHMLWDYTPDTLGITRHTLVVA